MHRVSATLRVLHTSCRPLGPQHAWGTPALFAAVRWQPDRSRALYCCATLQQEEQEGSAVEAKRLGKRKVALFLGYEGTGYKGLQMQKGGAPQDTIEDVLEEALFQIGGILPTNRGSLQKIGWSRSSRTDKNVHSLSTVVGVKMELDPDAFEVDPEGVEVARSINAHLPEQVRVFSVQRVSKSWSARSECIRRAYRYYLPASLLGLRLDGGAEDAATLERLSTAWGAFEGNHAFHNYTRRRIYRQQPPPGGSAAARAAAAQTAAAPGSSSSSSRSGSDGEEGEDDEEGEEELPLELEQASSTVEAGSSSNGQAGEGRDRRGRVQILWKGVREEADPVVKRHFRYMEQCKAGPGLVTLVPGGPPCVELSVLGGSFMLHQIRHMVGVAAAVARGNLPPEIVELSMAPPVRMNLPRAPPSTLLLSAAQFSPFKRSYCGKAAAASKWSGEQLELREGGQALQAAFERQRLRPALSALLESPEWEEWGGALGLLWYDEVELRRAGEEHAFWREQQARRKLARMAEGAAACQTPGEV